MRRAYLVYNPNAGRYPSWLLAERAAGVMQKYGWQIHIETSRNGEHITQLARQAAAEQMEAFIVVGGDGSINHALPGLVGTSTALGVLPAGTANVWGQELGLPGLSWTRWLALEESAHRMAQAQVRQVDVGMCNTTPFLLWAGVGLDAFVIHHLEPRERWEKYFAVAQYAASAVWTAAAWGGLNLQVVTDLNQVSGHFLLAVVSNIHLYMGGMAQLSPDARLDDGWMDLWLFEGKTLGDTVQRAWDLWAGRHVQSDLVRRIPFQNITLMSDVPTYVQVDGEPIGSEGRVSITVQRHSLHVLVPMNVPRILFKETK